MGKALVAMFLAACAASAMALVEVNQASSAELMTIKGIGPTLSERIIDAREQGSFSDWHDLIERVRGIGYKNAARFSASGLIVNGASFRGVAITREVQERHKPARQDRRQAR